MRAIFVSYRRDDSEGEAGRLFDDLVSQFGENSVFMDVAAIEVGRDFRKAIDESVSTCGVLLAVIGKEWIDSKNEAGQRRLDDPSDFVRLETASALKRDIPVIPVLVRAAKMPRPEQLPEDLKELAYRNGVELTHARWNSDLQLLIKALRRLVDSPAKEAESPSVPALVSRKEEVPASPSLKLDETRRSQPSTVPGWKSNRAVFALIAIATFLAAGAAYRFWPRQEAVALVEVPTLVGKSLDVATRTLEEQHLAVGTVSREPRSNVAENTVLDAFPKPGKKVDSGSAVDLVVSESPGKSTSTLVGVPNLVGLSLDQARNQLQTIGLVLGHLTYEPKAGVIPGTVLGQSPTAGLQVQKDSRVGLTLSKEVVAQIQPMNVSASSNQQQVSAGQGTWINVAAKQPDGAAIPNASVSITTSGGTFKDSGDSKVIGSTSNNGNYSSFWTAPLKVADSYILEVTVTKGGFQGWKGQVAVQINRSPLATPAKKALPNFAGTWEVFETSLNGAPQPIKKGGGTVITQEGSLVHVGKQSLTITSVGTITRQSFFIHEVDSIHEVSTEKEADFVDTFTWRLEGAILVFELVSETKRQYKLSNGSTQYPHTEVRIIKYRRLAP